MEEDMEEEEEDAGMWTSSWPPIVEDYGGGTGDFFLSQMGFEEDDVQGGDDVQETQYLESWEGEVE